MNTFWWLVLIYLISVALYKRLEKYISAFDKPESNSIIDMERLSYIVGYIPILNTVLLLSMIKDCIKIRKVRKAVSKAFKRASDKFYEIGDIERGDKYKALSKEALK